jgi:predicted aspartyl protease
MDSQSGVRHRQLPAAGQAVLLLAGLLCIGAVDAPVMLPVPEPPQLGAPPSPDSIPDIVVEAPEPRYVAPTRHDKIGRIWAPVMINGKGPFRLVLDTGASHSAVNAGVAAALGIPLANATEVKLLGVTGSATVPTIAVDSLIVGDLELQSRRLPIVIDALGGAEGILGTEGLLDKRIFIDFRHDKITIFKSHNEHAALGFVTIPVHIVRGLLLVADARIGTVPTKAIIDTGGQATIANIALREALARRYREGKVIMDEITGATLDVQKGDRIHVPPISLGDLTISDMQITTADMYIFQHWNMTREPAILIGMDVLGLLDTLIIDYRRKELQIRTRSGG